MCISIPELDATTEAMENVKLGIGGNNYAGRNSDGYEGVYDRGHGYARKV